MLLIESTNQFKKDYKLAQKRGKNMGLLDMLIRKIASEEKLNQRYRDHALTGNWHSHRELHIENDWLLVYRLTNSSVVFVRTGTHSDLFK